MNEPLDFSELLRSLDEPSDIDTDAALSARVLADGLNVARRRRIRRRLLHAAVSVSLFAAGFVTHAGMPARPEPGGRQQSPAAVPTALAADGQQLEVMAELADDTEQGDWYRQAGDAWLAVGDTVSATRCYRHHLRRLGDAPRLGAHEDSWLLLALRRTLDD